MQVITKLVKTSCIEPKYGHSTPQNEKPINMPLPRQTPDLYRPSSTSE